MLLSTMRVLVLPFLILQMSTPSYQAEIEQWRHEREARLRADDGWLTVAGLFWLRDGSNRLGTDKSNDIVLPPGSAPPSVGGLEFHNGKTTLQVAQGVKAMVNGAFVTSATLKPDVSGSPDIVQINELTMFVIQRGNRFGIRLKDKNSEMRKAFTDLKYFPVPFFRGPVERKWGFFLTMTARKRAPRAHGNRGEV